MYKVVFEEFEKEEKYRNYIIDKYMKATEKVLQKLH